eukprot:1010747-Alexandrium_andersonii.AAC.1
MFLRAKAEDDEHAIPCLSAICTKTCVARAEVCPKKGADDHNEQELGKSVEEFGLAGTLVLQTTRSPRW